MDETTVAARKLAETLVERELIWRQTNGPPGPVVLRFAHVIDDAGMAKAVAKLRGMARRQNINGPVFRADAAAVLAALEGRKR